MTTGEKPPGQTVASQIYHVTSINGKTPLPPVGRGNRYEIILHPKGISVSLGCSTIALAGRIVEGRFAPSKADEGAIVTESGTCGIPITQQLEPHFQKALLSGSVRTVRTDQKISLWSSDLKIEGITD